VKPVEETKQEPAEATKSRERKPKAERGADGEKIKRGGKRGERGGKQMVYQAKTKADDAESPVQVVEAVIVVEEPKVADDAILVIVEDKPTHEHKKHHDHHEKKVHHDHHEKHEKKSHHEHHEKKHEPVVEKKHEPAPEKKVEPEATKAPQQQPMFPQFPQMAFDPKMMQFQQPMMNPMGNGPDGKPLTPEQLAMQTQ
jgi:hypothetical protein